MIINNIHYYLVANSNNIIRIHDNTMETINNNDFLQDYLEYRSQNNLSY